MELPDYYKMLGIPHDAPPEEIKRAYKEKALKYHPDVYNGEFAVEIFQFINMAYHTLIDPALRRQYDLKLKFPEYFANEKKQNKYRHAADARYYGRAEHKPQAAPKHYARNIRRLNNFMLYSMVALLGFGIVMGAIDMIRTSDFTMLLTSIVCMIIIISGVRIIKRSRYHKTKF